MSSEEDQCFQCQELGHTAHHFLNIRCFECEEYSHIAADCAGRIPLSSTPAHHKRHHSNARHHTRSTHHTGGHPDIEAPPLIPEIAADLEHIHHTNQVKPPLLNLHPVLAGQQ